MVFKASAKDLSWGRVKEDDQRMIVPASVSDLTQFLTKQQHDGDGSLLVHGLGRSYGDVSLNTPGSLVSTKFLTNIISFDSENGTIECESGVSFSEILHVYVAKGWFLPVTPGTKYITVGGAIANDVHGKNHHNAGTFGNHVLSFKLLRSDGKIYHCSPTENKELFSATIGGMGLTGIILSAQFKLIPIKSSFINQKIVAFENIKDYFTKSEKYESQYPYSVAWLDSLAVGDKTGRGVIMLGEHADATYGFHKPNSFFHKGFLFIPIDAPDFILRNTGIQAFNNLYYNLKARQQGEDFITHYEPFFYPLDSVNNWNKLYGKRGFYQLQFTLQKDKKDVMNEVMDRISNSKLGSFLAVLKTFGDIPSPGMLSYPRPGYTLALDFANNGKETKTLIKDLMKLIAEHHGQFYPAKDLLMDSKEYYESYPRWKDFIKHIDPGMNSDFWRRTGCERPKS